MTDRLDNPIFQAARRLAVTRPWTWLRKRRGNGADAHGGDPRTPVRKKPSLDFSVTGLVYCSMMLFMGLAAVNTQANLLFGVFGLMIGILLISGVISRMVLSRLRLARVLPEHAIVGQPSSIVYEFHNHKRFWPSLSVCMGELDGNEAFIHQPQAYLLHAAPQMTASVPLEIMPKRRGLHALGTYQLSTSFPFGFIKRAMERTQRDNLLIFPAIGKVDPRVMAMCRSAEKTGATMKPRRGGQDEFYGVKEYRSGENPRWIYWRRSARAGVLISKEMTQVAPPRIIVLCDTCIADRTRREHEAVEKTIAMAGSLASHALEAGMSVGLAAWHHGWTLVPPQRGKRHRLDILGILARLPLNTAAGAQDLLDESRDLMAAGATPILFTPRPAELALGDHIRSGMLIVPAGSLQGERWFHFETAVDFSRCMPPDQQPDLTAEEVPVEPSVNSTMGVNA